MAKERAGFSISHPAPSRDNMNQLLAILSFIIVIAVTIPYMIDIVQGRAKPARAARFMFFAMLLLALAQQHSLGGGYVLAVTIGEFISSLLLLGLAVKYGVGGLSKSDLICYMLLIIDVVVWLTTKNALLALHLTVLADMISFWPTVSKTWREPSSETSLFFWGGSIAPLLSIIAGGSLDYSAIVFPIYLSLVNLIEVTLINRK